MTITTRAQVSDAYVTFGRLDSLKAIEDAVSPASPARLTANGRQIDLTREELAAVLTLLRAPLVDRVQRLGVEA